MCITRITVNTENATGGEYLSASSLKGIPWRNGEKLYLDVRKQFSVYVYDH